MAKTTRRDSDRPLAVVTGASAGIGAAFAERLAGDQYDLVTVARDGTRLESRAAALRDAHGVAVEVLPADLTDPDGVAAVERRLAAGKAPDLLVNNAGFGTNGMFAELDVAREEQEIRLNVLALVRLTRAALPGMIERGDGAIINVSSMAALIPTPMNTTYGATKAFVNHFTESLALELEGTGVVVQALCPGFTRTEFQERAGVDTSRLPERAWMSAEEVVDASLAALDGGDLICIPGTQNKVLAGLTGAMPRMVVRRIAGFGSRRLLQ